MQACLLLLDLGRQSEVMDMLNLVPHFHCHPSNTVSIEGPQRSKLVCCQRTAKFGKGNSGCRSGVPQWEGAFYFETCRQDSSYPYEEDENSRTKMYTQM